MKAERKKQKAEARKKTKMFRFTTLAAMLLYAALFVLSVVAGVASSLDENYVYEPGSVCEETITATKDIVDEYTTELLKQEAMQKVTPVYQHDQAALTQYEGKIQAFFTSAEQVRQAARQIYLEQIAPILSFDPKSVDWEAALSERMDDSKDMVGLKDMLPSYALAEDVYAISAMTQRELTELRDGILAQVRLKFTDGVTQEDLSAVIETIRSALSADQDNTAEQVSLAYRVVKNNVDANKIFDFEATQAKKAEVAEGIAPVEYKKGQTIVRQGDVISEAQYQLIKQLGLANTSSSSQARWIASGLLLAVLFAIPAIYAYYMDQSLYREFKTLVSLISLTMLAIVMALISKNVDLRLCPAFLAAIVGAVVFTRRTALFYSVFVSLLSAFILSPDKAFLFDEQVVRSLFAQLLGSCVAVLMMRRKQSRSEYILSGFSAGLAAAAVYVSYGVLNSFNFSQYLTVAVYGIASGLVCGFLSVGVLPVWETVFSLTTPSRLLELTEPSRPLLRRLMIEAPGTYHHSMMVANLAEAAAEVTGADSLLVRVCAYYHDIGKLSNPVMFAENQTGIQNPHDSLNDPKQSADIIRKHILDGRRLAEKHKLPKNIIEIISEHHGDSTVGYFYYMAKKQDENVSPEDYKYQAKKPQSKEAGILMLADAVEAAIRARNASQSPDLKKQVTELVNSKYDDGQFDECPLTKRDITNCINAFCNVFAGASHERINYPGREEK